MKAYLLIIFVFALLNCGSNPTSKDIDIKPTDHTIGTMGAEMRLEICIPTCRYYNLSSDTNKLGSQGQCYYDYLIPINEMNNIAQNLSDTLVFIWEDMSSVVPYPSNDCYLSVYGDTFNDFICSIGKGNSAGNLL